MTNYVPPQVEEYHSDDSEDHVLESSFAGRGSPTANQANVTAKRSHPSDLGSEKQPAQDKVVNIDLQSDSGYSSHTAATMSSADSAPSAKSSQSPPIVPASAAPIPPPSPATRRRPTLGDERKSSSSSSSKGSPRRPLQRTSSVSSRRPPTERERTRRPTVVDCDDPNCTKCGPNALPIRSRRPAPSHLDSGLDLSSTASDQRSQRSDPAPSYTTPPSPTYTRQPAPYAQGSAIVQPAQTRRRSSSTTRRPMSYHGDPGQSYWVPSMPAPYPSPPQDHGPPPSMSARWAIQQNPQMSQYMMGTPPANGYYPSGYPMPQTSPPYETQRPALSARNSSNYATRRNSNYGPPLITQDQSQPLPSARFHSQPQSARQERFPDFDDDDESESSESEYTDEEDDRHYRNTRDPRVARALMPPPQLPQKAPQQATQQRRPSLRHSKTYSVDRRMSQSQTLPERPKERDPRDPRDPRASRVSNTAAPSRANSVSRPALIQHPKAKSAFETTRNAQVVVENSRSRRGQSYQDYDKVYERQHADEQKRRNRTSKVFRDEFVDRDDAIAVSDRRRRPTNDSRRQDEYIMEAKNKRTQLDAEAYQQAVRGSNDPFNEQVHKAAKRASRVPSGPSDSGSSRSKGSDGKSRVSQSNRTTVTNGGNGEIRLRVDASAPLSLQFNGDMDGRTLRIDPAEGGMADIVIGGNQRNNESTYRSEKGSVTGASRKSVAANQARREAEESSIRSGSTRQSRRDGERRVLRRRRDTEYN